MKVNALRIGNWVHQHMTSTCMYRLKVCSIGRNNVRDSFGDKYSYDNISPIRLTEEWLERFCERLLNISNKPYWQMPKGGAIMKRGKTSIGEAGFYHHITNVKLDYVHQLQNLYFALTGEELTLNEEEL